ncbi:MAG: M67 family metallopeptidase [Fibrobacter sp.]|uniref:M67 family metallopeptidase n=1 Tax=Fibrobacter sp. TaxID=35828 RepID=UPI0025BFAB8E|nr:M67 family metallopeptidase [Fibrobacter sp.]MBQ7079203.1 M67 family metallopeptidase [Fibrobacter sp.]
MEPKFSKIVSTQMESAAKKAYPCECCGILVGKKSEKGEIEVTEIREASNQIQGEEEATHFRIDPLNLYYIERELESSNLEIVGFYHSHPDCKAILSDEDRKYMVPGLVYTIMSITAQGVVDVKSYTRDRV